MMFRQDLLKGKKVLITGGGTGLGKSVGRRYMELGAELVICGRRAEVLEATVKEHREATGGRASFHVCDVRSAEAIEGMFEAIWKNGPLDVVVNNAAGNFIARTETLSPRAADAVLNIVLHGSMYCTLAAGKRWIGAKRKGTVLSIISTPALTGAAFTVPSAIAKAGVLSMTRSLAVEWGPKNIRLVAVAPGFFPTPGAWEQLYPEGSQVRDQRLDVALRRYGEHSELANLCSYLVSEEAGYITGDAIVIDGGRWMQGVGGPSVAAMQDWDDAQWETMRKKGRG
jgi:NAD(P)-dependent dehydrogenase (short-subunit alcohol dehydrogenase family)